MPIWYLKRPENYEDRRIGPGIFFGGTKLPKKPLERKLASGQQPPSTAAAPAVHIGSYRPPRRHLPPSTAAAPSLQPGFSYKYSPDSSFLGTQSVLTDALFSPTLLAVLLLLFRQHWLKYLVN
ncbi:hypothetical protein JCGZ_01758 [Jatropha curcas]|uniref:Uncharacterized protein n=1 Tax=Jatropha curcas TaxID=180498 RepID=A0A067JSG0_JATCU|nr:hypothetical protein JCGZ_01758 [Jatropha curcas]